VYACQDVEFDRQEGLYSIPAKFGLTRGLEVSAVLHVLAPLLFIAVGVLMPLNWIYYLGVLGAVILLYRQHRIVSAKDLSKIGVAFFNLNGYLSVLLFAFSLIDLFIFI
ncbi:MAG: UbiA family prenyltransferase, partial [Desulfitobacteriaceae bacterium]